MDTSNLQLRNGSLAPSTRFRDGFWFVFAAGLLFRLIYTYMGFVDLAPDEAYYWQWSRNLDWCYYSKGPLVAYLMRLGTLLGGHTAFGVRFPTVLLSGVILYVSYLLYRKLFPRDDRGLFLMALFYHAVPLMLVGSLIATIDPPLCAAWVICTYALYCAAAENRSWGWWTLGIALGFGILAKYTMLLYLPAILMYLALSPKNRVWLLRPQPYLAIAGGLLFTIPLLLWNSNHDWVSFHHTAALGKIGQSTFSIFNLKYFVDMILTQAGIASPILFILLLVGLATHVRNGFFFPRREGSLLLVCTIAPVLILYTLLTLKRSINPNWLAAVYPALIMMGASACSQIRQYGKGFAWVGGGLLLGLLLCFVLLFSDVIHVLGLPQSERWDPAARLKGWKQFASLAQSARDEFAPDDRVFFFGTKYQTASELAFYLPGRPRTYCASSHPLSNQYDMWGGSRDLLGWNAVYVRRSKKSVDLTVPDFVASSFERIEPAGEETVSRFGITIRYHKAWKCYGFRGWILDTEFRRGSES